MRELLLRILRRSIPVVLILGIMGYLFAEAYLMAIRTMNKGVVNAVNDDIKWQAPLRMAGFGLALFIVLECVAFAIRRKKPPTTELKAAADDKSEPLA